MSVPHGASANPRSMRVVLVVGRAKDQKKQWLDGSEDVADADFAATSKHAPRGWIARISKDQENVISSGDDGNKEPILG